MKSLPAEHKSENWCQNEGEGNEKSGIDFRVCAGENKSKNSDWNKQRAKIDATVKTEQNRFEKFKSTNKNAKSIKPQAWTFEDKNGHKNKRKKAQKAQNCHRFQKKTLFYSQNSSACHNQIVSNLKDFKPKSRFFGIFMRYFRIFMSFYIFSQIV